MQIRSCICFVSNGRRDTPPPRHCIWCLTIRRGQIGSHLLAAARWPRAAVGARRHLDRAFRTMNNNRSNDTSIWRVTSLRASLPNTTCKWGGTPGAERPGPATELPAKSETSNVGLLQIHDQLSTSAGCQLLDTKRFTCLQMPAKVGRCAIANSVIAAAICGLSATRRSSVGRGLHGCAMEMSVREWGPSTGYRYCLPALVITRTS